MKMTYDFTENPQSLLDTVVRGFFALTLKSRNRKTGDIPVSTSHAGTCPDSCAFKKNGCYGDGGHVRLFWDKVTHGKAGGTWAQFLEGVLSLKEAQLWRLNQVGDLPPKIIDGEKTEYIDQGALAQLVKANKGKRGFGFTHYPMQFVVNYIAIRKANQEGLTINASCNNIQEAETLAKHVYKEGPNKAPEIPLAVVLPQELEIQENESLQEYRARIPKETPQGYKLTICPATYQDTNCKACQLCSVSKRKAIVGFPAHGISVKKADLVAQGG